VESVWMSVSDKLSATKPFDRFLLNSIKYSLPNVAKQVWVSWKPSAWQSSFSYERKYTPNGNFRISLQVWVRFGLENLQLVPFSNCEFRVSCDSESHCLCLFSTTHCSLLRLIVRSGLDVPTFATRRLHACHHARAPSSGRRNCWREISENFA